MCSFHCIRLYFFGYIHNQFDDKKERLLSWDKYVFVVRSIFYFFYQACYNNYNDNIEIIFLVSVQRYWDFHPIHTFSKSGVGRKNCFVLVYFCSFIKAISSQSDNQPFLCSLLCMSKTIQYRFTFIQIGTIDTNIDTGMWFG